MVSPKDITIKGQSWIRWTSGFAKAKELKVVSQTQTWINVYIQVKAVQSHQSQNLRSLQRWWILAHQPWLIGKPLEILSLLKCALLFHNSHMISFPLSRRLPQMWVGRISSFQIRETSRKMLLLFRLKMLRDIWWGNGALWQLCLQKYG